MKKDPHCYWCGKEVIYYELKHGERTPHNFATLDHLYSRYSPLRREVHFKEKTLVLACNACNHRRGIEETMALPVEERRARSGAPEKNWK